jgi:hypothetical protein
MIFFLFYSILRTTYQIDQMNAIVRRNIFSGQLKYSNIA